MKYYRIFLTLTSYVFRDLKINRTAVLEILKMYFLDNCRSRVLAPDGLWSLRRPEPGQDAYRVQERLYRSVKSAVETARLAPRQEFVVRRKPAGDRD